MRPGKGRGLLNPLLVLRGVGGKFCEKKFASLLLSFFSPSSIFGGGRGGGHLDVTVFLRCLLAFLLLYA